MSNDQPLDLFPLWAIYLLTVLVALLAAEIGYRLGRARRRQAPDEKEGPSGAMASATLALLAFLLAIITGIDLNRFEQRRELVIDEANAIGTTYLRAGYLTEPYGTEIRALLREYVDARLALIDLRTQQAARIRSEALQNELWARAEIVAQEGTPTVAIFIQSLNDVIDLHTKRFAVRDTRVPPMIWLGIFTAVILSVMLVGYHNGLQGGRNLIALLILILVFSAVILLIMDLDRPQEGILRVSQQSMIDLQRQINAPTP